MIKIKKIVILLMFIFTVAFTIEAKALGFGLSGIGYDKNNCVTDYEKDFGDFDTYEEAYDLFVKLQCKDENSFFANKTDLYQLLIQVEECEETEDYIECIDVKNEWWITNPNYNDYDF